jgi:lysozyme
MIPSSRCIDLIKQFEGLSLKSYKCPANVWTIGYGSTHYEDTSKVKEGEKITLQRAEDLLKWEISMLSTRFPKLDINQNQFDALISFAFNVGLNAFLNSTLLKIIKKNPDDLEICDELKKWSKARQSGRLKVLPGLLRRRTAECNLYFEK